MSEPKATPWHDHREPVFALMRAIDSEAETLHRRGSSLAAGPGIPVGGAAFDETLKAEALWAFLRGLRHGMTPADAAAVALEQSRAIVRTWNANPRCVTIGGAYTVHRWEDTCGAMLEDRARRFAGIGPADPLPEFVL